MGRQEIVGMLRFDAIRFERSLWKIVQVLRDNHIATSHNRCRQHMAIIGIREFKTGNQRFIPCDEGIPDSSIHQRAGAL